MGHQQTMAMLVITRGYILHVDGRPFFDVAHGIFDAEDWLSSLVLAPRTTHLFGHRGREPQRPEPRSIDWGIDWGWVNCQ